MGGWSLLFTCETTMLQYLAVLCVLSGVLCADLETDRNFDHYQCAPVSVDTTRWKAVVKLTQPIKLIKVGGGEVTYIRDDGLYLEVVGETDTPLACISLHGTVLSQTPEVSVDISSLEDTELPAAREIRSLRVRRATEIWRVRSVPETTERRTLLEPFEPYHRQWGDNSLSGSTDHSSDPALTVHYAQGSYTQTRDIPRGAGFYTTMPELPDGVDHLILKYDVYFENFGFGNMGKLPGLFGGEIGDGAYACSGGSNPPSCFSLRLMWRQNGDGELYSYIPTNQEDGFNDRDDVIAHSAYGQSIGRGKIRFQADKWQTVTEEATLNTIGNTDGQVIFCNQVSGGDQECYTASNLLMRNDANHHLRGIFFSTFFGGSNPADAAPNDCRAYFKDFRLLLPDDVVVG